MSNFQNIARLLPNGPPVAWDTQAMTLDYHNFELEAHICNHRSENKTQWSRSQ